MESQSHLGHVFSLFRGLWAAEYVQISSYGPLPGPIFVGGGGSCGSFSRFGQLFGDDQIVAGPDSRQSFGVRLQPVRVDDRLGGGPAFGRGRPRGEAAVHPEMGGRMAGKANPRGLASGAPGKAQVPINS